jgi:protein-tyrosine-phosphatase
MFRNVHDYCTSLTLQFDTIPSHRQTLLLELSDYIAAQIAMQKDINLLFVCTHNSRRSHFGQIWAAVAADFFDVQTVHAFSGGTESTCFNENAIEALISLGFNINATTDTNNPVYHVIFSEQQTITCFSKRYDDNVNPHANFAAIMTCSDAEQNCPVIFGADKRIGICYDDPKASDNTPMQETAYHARCEQIALEMLFVFAQQTK